MANRAPNLLKLQGFGSDQLTHYILRYLSQGDTQTTEFGNKAVKRLKRRGGYEGTGCRGRRAGASDTVGAPLVGARLRPNKRPRSRLRGRTSRPKRPRRPEKAGRKTEK